MCSGDWAKIWLSAQCTQTLLLLPLPEKTHEWVCETTLLFPCEWLCLRALGKLVGAQGKIDNWTPIPTTVFFKKIHFYLVGSGKLDFLLTRCYVYFFLYIKNKFLVLLNPRQLHGLKFYLVKLIICSLHMMFCHAVFDFGISDILVCGGLSAGCSGWGNVTSLLHISEKYSSATGVYFLKNFFSTWGQCLLWLRQFCEDTFPILSINVVAPVLGLFNRTAPGDVRR